MLCIIITSIWWDISNSYMARGWSALLWIFQRKILIAVIFFNTTELSALISNKVCYVNGSFKACMPKWLLFQRFHADECRTSHRKCSVKKVFLEISQNSQENSCAIVSFLIKLQASPSNFIKKETLAQVFSCEFCEISKSNFFYRTPLGDCFCECFYVLALKTSALGLISFVRLDGREDIQSLKSAWSVLHSELIARVLSPL